MKKKGVLQLALQLNFWVASNTCNSPYLYIMSVIEQVVTIAKVAIHHIYDAIHYNSITTLSQQFFSTMQLPYDYNHNVMLMSFSSIHQNLTHGTMRIVCDFFEILISIIHYDYSFDMVLDYDTWHNPKLPHDILIEFWKQIYICIST